MGVDAARFPVEGFTRIWTSPSQDAVQREPGIIHQYVHARVCSIFREAESKGFTCRTIPLSS